MFFRPFIQLCDYNDMLSSSTDVGSKATVIFMVIFANAYYEHCNMR